MIFSSGAASIGSGWLFVVVVDIPPTGSTSLLIECLGQSCLRGLFYVGLLGYASTFSCPAARCLENSSFHIIMMLSGYWAKILHVEIFL